MNKPLTLTNLTEEQVEMLDFMWSLETLGDLHEWQSSLDAEQFNMSQILMTLVIQEAVEDLIMENLSEARTVLKKFML
jgi:hypothetical protein